MMPQFMPMVVPSRPWTHYDRGGHLLSDQEVVRLHGNMLQREALKIADSLPLPQRAISQARRPAGPQRLRALALAVERPCTIWSLMRNASPHAALNW